MWTKKITYTGKQDLQNFQLLYAFKIKEGRKTTWRWEKARQRLDGSIVNKTLEGGFLSKGSEKRYFKGVLNWMYWNKGLLKAKIKLLLKKLYTWDVTTHDCQVRNLWSDHPVRLLSVEPLFCLHCALCLI